jgi:hypothetical protein
VGMGCGVGLSSGSVETSGPGGDRQRPGAFRMTPVEEPVGAA